MKAPPRLVDTEGPVADLLRAALAEDEARNATLLRVSSIAKSGRAGSRDSRSVVRRIWIPLAAAAGIGLALGLARLVDEERFVIEREAWTPPVTIARSPSSRTEHDEPTSSNGTESLRPSKSPVEAEGRTASSERRSARTLQPKSSRTNEECSLLTRSSKFVEALECFSRESKEPGLRGELAWMERARIQRRALRDAPGALETLESYLGTHPSGALRQEALLSQLELLLALRKESEALALAKELLASGLAEERRGELEKIRAKLEGRSMDDEGR